MKEDNNSNKDYSIVLNSDNNGNEKNVKTSENLDENNKIYIPPEINPITENKEENKLGLYLNIILCKKKRLINEIDYILDNIDINEEDKKKYKKSFDCLKKDRKNEKEITEDEFDLLSILIHQLKNPNEINYDKIFNEEKNEINNLCLNKNKYLDDKEEETYVNKLYLLLKKKEKKNNDLIIKSLEKDKAENQMINVNKNIVNSDNLVQNKQSSNKNSCFKKFILYLRSLFNICFEEDISSYFNGYNLHISFIYYIIQYVLLTLSYYNTETKYEFNLVAIYATILSGVISVIIFYKMFFKKYSTNKKCLMIIYIYFILLFKIYIYFYLFLILNEGFHIENANKILSVSCSYKVIFYLYCWFYFFYRDGAINYQKVINFGITELLIVCLISLYWFPLTLIEIELILCSIEFIRFHIGIYIVKRNQSLINNSKLWNTLNFEVFSMAVYFFPIYSGIMILLTIMTFGLIFMCYKVNDI